MYSKRTWTAQLCCDWSPVMDVKTYATPLLIRVKPSKSNLEVGMAPARPGHVSSNCGSMRVWTTETCQLCYSFIAACVSVS